jgi:hypothetical protein
LNLIETVKGERAKTAKSGVDNFSLPVSNWFHMAKKKSLRRTHHRATVRRLGKSSENYLVVVRGWMLVVAFALMLGIGAIVGNFISQQLNLSTPTVAGASVAR